MNEQKILYLAILLLVIATTLAFVGVCNVNANGPDNKPEMIAASLTREHSPLNLDCVNMQMEPIRIDRYYNDEVVLYVSEVGMVGRFR